MNQPLPGHVFNILKDEECGQINWISFADDSSIGYFIECYLLYQDNLHEADNDLPLAAKKIYLKHEMLNANQLRILRHYSLPES